MGRVEFSVENKGKVVNFDFPKLKLKAGEKARIIVGLESPVMEYVHTLRKPVIADGQAVTEQVRNDRTGVTTTEYKKDFVGNPICLGDAGIIAEKGLDPAHCPACKLAKEHPDYTDAPKRRFAMHVVRYRTKAGTHNVATPFSTELLVWAFTDMVFNKITDAKEEWGDIREHDFLLGPCTNEGFQKFDINVGSEAAWKKNAEWKKNVIETFRENQIPDLTIACGRVVQPAWMQQDIDGIIEAWALAKGSADSKPGSQASLTEDLNGLLDNEGWAKDEMTSEPASTEEPAEASDGDDLFGGIDSLAASVNVPAEAPDGDDLFGDLLADSTSETAEETPAEAPEPAAEVKAPTKAKKAAAPAAAPAAEPSVDNFDDLLAGV